jgi:hypothetical protein
MTQKKPSILKMVQNFAKESINFIKQGAPITSTEEYEERIAICVSCEHFTKNRSCGLCGCHMPVKAGWKTSECADNPKRWNKIVLNKEEEDVLRRAAVAEAEHERDALRSKIRGGQSIKEIKLHAPIKKEDDGSSKK